MTDLVEFLRARLDEDERAACEAGQDAFSDEYGEFRSRGGELFAHVLRHDPARVLREVEAKRRILNAYTAQVAERQRSGVLHDAEMATGGEDSLDVAALMGEGIRANTWISHLGWVLRVLAAAYADHPDYRQEWKP
jgi:hypothetical protein